MNYKTLYTYLYKLFDNVTPLTVDCGGLCNAACCSGDEESGMYLFPGEQVMFKNEPWFKIEDSDFIFRNKPVKIFICKDFCPRNKRPLSCRIFPLFNNKTDIRGRGICPLATANFPLEQYNPEFIAAVKKTFNILNKFKSTREYVIETEKLIDEFDIFKKV